MIHYDSDQILSFLKWKGSVAPNGLKWAVPCSLLCLLYHTIINSWTDLGNFVWEPSVYETTGWGLFTSVLGFLLVFRAQLAYGRYWEGITLVEQACGVWLNGCSNLIAFCSPDPAKQEKVEEFQYILSRLMSLLVCYSMCDISNLDRSRFPHLDLDGIDPASVEYLENTSAKVNVAMQWLQRLVVENARSGVIDVAPPILSRVFQEFSIGYVHFIDANKLSTVPFPFEFAQMVWLMLVFFCTLPVPLICAFGMGRLQAITYTFVIVFIFRSVHCIAVELELPFGDDPNDLPLDRVNHRFNRVLQRLLDAKAQQTPTLQRNVDTSCCLLRSESFQETDQAAGAARIERTSQRKMSGMVGRFLRSTSLDRDGGDRLSVAGKSQDVSMMLTSSVPIADRDPLHRISRRASQRSRDSELTVDSNTSTRPGPSPRPTPSPRPPPAAEAGTVEELGTSSSGAEEEMCEFPSPRHSQCNATPVAKPGIVGAKENLQSAAGPMANTGSWSERVLGGNGTARV